jgi:NAD(P)-dependent dehydrogenase (short-subunit alcohol dehydrogenase family)
MSLSRRWSRSDVNSQGANGEGFVADLGEESAAGIVVDKVIAAFGKLDVLVNNVGIRRYEPLAEHVGRDRADQPVEPCIYGQGGTSGSPPEWEERHKRIFDVRCLRSQRHGRLRRNEGSRRT